MFSLIKFFLFFVVIVAGGMVAFNKFPSLREHALAMINPTAFREQQIVNELKDNLSTANITLQNLSTATNIQDAKTKTAVAQKLINTALELNNELAQLNKDDSGIIGSTISTVAKALSQVPGLGITNPTTTVSPMANNGTTSPQSSQAICPPPSK